MQKNSPLFILTIFPLAIVLSHSQIHAQDLDCVVKVKYESVPTANKDLLVNFEAEVRDYVNNYQWGPDKNLEEKTKCTFDINQPFTAPAAMPRTNQRPDKK